jgi:hypothetical protein
MEMAGKQFSPFMEMVVQLCLTVCATMSYGLWKWLISSSPRLWKWLCNHVLQLVQPCLTACATASYGLWKWLASSSSRLWKWLCNCVLQLVQLRLTVYGNGWQAVLPIYGNGFRSGTSENQRLHKKLGNSENRVTYRLR